MDEVGGVVMGATEECIWDAIIAADKARRSATDNQAAAEVVRVAIEALYRAISLLRKAEVQGSVGASGDGQGASGPSA